MSVKKNCQPKFVLARSVPFAIKNDAIARNIERLQSLGIIAKVEFSRWAMPIVPAPKRDRDEKSKELVTISTHLGLFRYNRLPFGVPSAPTIFQLTMDQLLNGLPGVKCYLDDIIITGSNHREHLNNLDWVLERLRDKGLRLKKSKCHCMQSSMEYLGHVLAVNGVHTTPSKQRAIAEARAPSNVTELRSFFGIGNYYGHFLPNVSTVLHPLNRLLRKGVSWLCQEVFQAIKEMLSSDLVLAQYDPMLP